MAQPKQTAEITREAALQVLETYVQDHGVDVTLGSYEHLSQMRAEQMLRYLRNWT